MSVDQYYFVVVNVVHHFVRSENDDAFLPDWQRLVDEVHPTQLRTLACFGKDDGYLTAEVKRYGIDVKESEIAWTIQEYFEKHPEVLARMNLKIQDVDGMSYEATNVVWGNTSVRLSLGNTMFMFRELKEAMMLLKTPIVWTCKRFEKVEREV